MRHAAAQQTDTCALNSAVCMQVALALCRCSLLSLTLTLPHVDCRPARSLLAATAKPQRGCVANCGKTGVVTCDMMSCFQTAQVTARGGTQSNPTATVTFSNCLKVRITPPEAVLAVSPDA
jgi:hypothetical protein